MKFWHPLLFFAVFLAAGIALGALIAIPDKWDKATVIKICRDGTPILRLEDGTMWARRNGFSHYRVEDEKSVCGS